MQARHTLESIIGSGSDRAHRRNTRHPGSLQVSAGVAELQSVGCGGERGRQSVRQASDDRIGGHVAQTPHSVPGALVHGRLLFGTHTEDHRIQVLPTGIILDSY